MNNKPIADLLRPTSFSQVAGQGHLVSPRGVITRMMGAGRISNMIFFGPPGTGKTTVTAYAPNGVKGELIVRVK